MKNNLTKNLMADIQKSYDEKDRGGVQGKQYLKIGGDVSKLKLEVGRNAVDIIPFIHGTDVFPGKSKGDISFMLDVYVHKYFNQKYDQVVCLKKTFGKPCPICEARAQLMDADSDKYKDEIATYKPKRRFIANAINLRPNEEDEHSGELQVMDEVHYFFYKELIEEARDPDTGDYTDFVSTDETGHSVRFRASQETNGKAKYLKFKSFSFEERDEGYDDSIIDEAFKLDSLLVIPTYEEVEAMMHEEEVVVDTKEVDEDDDDDKPVKSKKKSKKSYKKAKPAPEPDEDDENEDEDDDDEDDEDVAEDAEDCPYGKVFGKDGDMDDAVCLKCKKAHPDTFKSCIVESM